MIESSAGAFVFTSLITAFSGCLRLDTIVKLAGILRTFFFA